MGKINRNNYPVWFTDYHDGTLDSNLLDELLTFLSDNPDLKEEFEHYSTHTLQNDLPIMPGKKSLRKEFGDLTASQQEELTAAAAEGDITSSESEQVMEYINSSPHLNDLYKTLKKIRLSPPDISCPHKKALKHYPLAVRIRKAVVPILAGAASIAVFLSIIMLVTKDQLHTIPLISSADKDPAAVNQTEIPSQGTGIKKLTPGNKSGSEVIIGKTSENRNNTLMQKRETLGNKSVMSGDAGNLKINKINIPESNIKETDSPDEKMGDRTNSQPIPVNEIEIPIITESIAYNCQLLEMSSEEEVEYNSYNSPRQFFAKTFREKILMEENPTSERLTPIELADATVTGINKLLGWEMKFEKEIENNGLINSISFTSQLVKFDYKLKNSDKEL